MDPKYNSDTDSDTDSDTGAPMDTGAMSPKSPGRTHLAGIISEFGQLPLEFIAASVMVNLDDEMTKKNHEERQENEDETNFFSLAPNKAIGDDVDSQFSASTPRAQGVNLRTELTELRQFMDILKTKITKNSEQFFHELQEYMREEAPSIQVYGNHPIVARLGQDMLVPMLSFYGIATKDAVSRFIKPKIDKISQDILQMTIDSFTTPAKFTPDKFPGSKVDFVAPTTANMVWNIRLILNGNIFTLLTFRIVAMNHVVFEPQIPGVTRDCFKHYLLDTSKHVDPKAMTLLLQELGVSVVSQELGVSVVSQEDGNMYHFPHNLQYLDDTQHRRILEQLKPEVNAEFASRLRITLQNYCLHLCLALLSKACSDKFNCVCAMPNIDVKLFELINNEKDLQHFASYVETFIDALDEPRLDSKQSYMITALHNLVANSLDTSQTGETLAYQKLFDGDVPGSGANTFNPIMRQITELIQIARILGIELQFSLCGGKMIYELGKILREYIDEQLEQRKQGKQDNLNMPDLLIQVMMKLLNIPSDADLAVTLAGYIDLDPGYVQSLLMFFTLCSQLGIKKIVDNVCTNTKDQDLFLKERSVIGISIVGGAFQLSSTRNSCNALEFLKDINSSYIKANPILDDFFEKNKPRLITSSSLASWDLVPKIPSGNYIVKISNHIFDSGYTPIQIPAIIYNIKANLLQIADKISRYSMSTDQGFSSPIKVLFDIFFTLFSIENFTNRAFVTQKINKELKRIAICASILFFHFQELLQMPHLYPEGSPERGEITIMLQILGRVINYGYDTKITLISTRIDDIMTDYASCFVQLLHLYNLDVVFYSRVPGATLPVIGIRNTLTSLEVKCMHMIKSDGAPVQSERLLQDSLQIIITRGHEFLSTIQKNRILASLIKLKERVMSEDLTYKAEGKFLTSIEAFERFLHGFPPVRGFPQVHGFVDILRDTPLVDNLAPLLEVFRNRELRLVELMQFKPKVVVVSDMLLYDSTNSSGLAISGEHQVGIYVILSIFGVKFKSEWSKISLFTQMLFRELFYRNMVPACQSLLGINISLIDPVKYRKSYENFIKDKILNDTLLDCEINVSALQSLEIYYGSRSIQNGINMYRNPLLDVGFIYTPNADVLSFKFLSAVVLDNLMLGFYDKFEHLLHYDAFQPRAYDLLLKRLKEKFISFTKYGKEHIGIADSVPILVNTFADMLLRLEQILKLEDLRHFIFSSELMNPPYSMVFEGKKTDTYKFLNLSPDQQLKWFNHLIELIAFFKKLSIIHSEHMELCKRNIKEYYELLFLLKNYLLPKREGHVDDGDDMGEEGDKLATHAPFASAAPLAAVAAASSSSSKKAAAPSKKAAAQQAAAQQAAVEPPKPAASNKSMGVKKPAARGGPPEKPSPLQKKGGGSSNALKTMPNRYSKNARTRKNKHKRKQPCKYKKKTNTKNNNKKKSKSKNVTFKRRKRSNLH